ncbi:MAG: MFS transporter [Legionellaceae bacterium]|nr:MFS transporter [Legionellaceae bacterium]
MLALQKELLQQSNYRNFVLSCMLAMFGNGLTYITMIWVLLEFHNSVSSTALLMAAFWLPNVILSPIAGIMVDRFSRWKLLIMANGARAMLILCFSVLLYQHFSASLIYGLAAFSGAVLALYAPSAITYVREIVRVEQLLAANTIVDMAYEMGAVLGMGCAGFLLAVFSPSVCFLVNAITYFMATIFVYYAPAHRQSKLLRSRESMRSQFFAGMHYLRCRPALILIYLLQGLFFVCYMTAPVLLAPFAKSVLHVNVLQFGFLEAALSVGIISGGLVTPWMARYFGVEKVILFQIMLGMVGFFGFSHSIWLQWALFFHLFIGVSFSIWALLTTLAQEMTALAFQGRVQSLFNSISGVVIMVFYYALGHMEHYQIESLYNIQIALYCLALLVFLLQQQMRRTSASGADHRLKSVE